MYRPHYLNTGLNITAIYADADVYSEQIEIIHYGGKVPRSYQLRKVPKRIRRGCSGGKRYKSNL